MVHTFRSGAECLRALELDDGATRRVVLIDSVVSDLSPANLCDALRVAYPDVAVLLVAAHSDIEATQRAMLAGARATIDRYAGSAELEQVIERVQETALAQEQGARVRKAATYGGDISGRSADGVIVPVIGGRGGAGRSTLSCALAWLAAESGVDTALVDFDLQFGDLNFLFGMGSGGQLQTEGCTDDEANLFSFLHELRDGGTAAVTRRFGRQLGECLTLYAPQPAPERAEAMSDMLPAALDALRREYALVVVNTGAYWTLFHAELLEYSAAALCVLDQTVPGVRATRILKDFCRRLGVPSSRLLCVMNRTQPDGLRAAEVAQVLRTDEVYCVSDGGRELASLLDSGDAGGLFARGAGFLAEVAVVLDELAVRSDLVLRSSASMRFSMRRKAALKGVF